MSPSLSLCVIAGFLWAGVGVAYNLTSKRGVHPASMLFVVSGCALLAVLPWCRWATDNESGWTERVELIKWMALSGIANWAGLIAMQLAMARGRVGLAWAIGQSAPLIPLVIAIVAHGERPSVTAWCGLAAMVAAVATMAHNGGSDGKEWRSTKWALAAFAIIGLQQTAMAEPSHRGLADPARLRLPIFYLIMFAVSGISCAVTLTPVRAATWLFGAAAAFASLFGQWLLLRTETIRYLGVSIW